ncbi:MAG TPA: MBG domain-containing protein, partial [Mobilitalea sp.]|nr:MBG domain-containing protein [Mobilitalea sp.]
MGTSILSNVHKKMCAHKTTTIVVLVTVFLFSLLFLLGEDRSEENYEGTLCNGVYGTQSNTSVTYNGEEQTGFVPEDWYDLSGDISAVEAGEYTVTATLVDPENTEWPDGTTEPKDIVWSIAKAKLRIKVHDYSICYGKDAPLYTSSYQGFMLGDNASNSITGAIKLECEYIKGNAAGVYSITASGLESINYDILYQSGTLTVIEKIINLPIANENLTYSGSDKIGVPYGDGYTRSNYMGKDAGNYTAIVSLIDDVNTTWPDSKNGPIEICWTIKKAPLDVMVSNIEITFGEEVPDYTSVCHGFTSEDDDVLTIKDISYQCEYFKGNPIGDYVISASGLNFLNYEITYTNGNLKVHKYIIQAPEIKSDLIYNGSIQNGILTRGGYNVIDNEGTTPGTYQSIAVLMDPINTSWPDETINDITMDWIIEKAPLTVIAENKSVKFGDDIPKYTCTFIGFIEGDTECLLFYESVIFNCEYNEESLPGNYLISLYGITSLNYDIKYMDGFLEVNKKAISLPTILKNLIYNGEDITGVLEGNGYNIVGNIGKDAKTYTATATLIDADNTKWADLDNGQKTISWSINKAPLLVTIDNFQIVFGDDAPTYNSRSEGLVFEDDASVTGNIEFLCDYVAGLNVGSYTITASGLESINYEISYVDGILTVDKKIINLPTVITGLIYNGEEQTGIQHGEEYFASGDRGTDAGEYVAIVMLNSNETTSWYDGTIDEKAVDWDIAPKSLSPEMICPICTQICVGSPVEPVAVNDEMNKLIEGDDYTVFYENNVSEGIATAVVTGLGNYVGTIQTEFDVLLGYLVKYDLNGLIGITPECQALVYGSIIDLTCTVDSTSAECTFIGWSLSSMGEAITEHIVTDDVTFYALWNNGSIPSS